MKAAVHKVEICVIDFEGFSPESIKNELELNKYLWVKAKNIKTKVIEWSDDHPLNVHATSEQAYLDLFKGDV